MLIGCLMFLVQDAAALEEAELRQADGYSETRNSGNVFAAGRNRDEQTTNIKCSRLPVYHHFHFYFLLLASDTHSSYSDYTSLSNDDHDPRYEHDNSAGIISYFSLQFVYNPHTPIQVFRFYYLSNPFFQYPDSAHALFVRATYLVCHRLISSWKVNILIFSTIINEYLLV